jgi:hypothetical protein
LTSNKISRERRQPIQSSLRPAIFDRDVLTLDVTDLVQAAPERGCHGSERLRRLSIQESNQRHRRLLRAGGKRPSRRRAAEQGDELAALHGDYGTSPLPPPGRSSGLPPLLRRL